MNEKKKKNLYIICGVIIFFLAVGTYLYKSKMDYYMVEQGGKHYFIFDDVTEYGRSFMNSSDYPLFISTVDYPTAHELVEAVKFGNLTKDDKEKIALFYRDKENRIESCDFDNFYQAIAAKGWNMSGVEWFGDSYTYDFENGEGKGEMKLYANKDFYLRVYESSRKVSKVIKTEYSEDGQKEIIYYSYNTTQTDVPNYKVIRYSLYDVDKQVNIQKTYTLPSETLVEIKAFGMKGKAYYRLCFDDWGDEINDISDEALLQFDVEKVVVISPGVMVVACLGLGTIGVVVYKKVKRRKEEPIM